MTDEDTIRKSGRVCVNELGPHFYVHSGSFEGRHTPPGMVDILFEVTHEELDNKLGDLKNVSWVEHIYPHTPFATVTWEETEDGKYVRNSMEVEIDDKNDDWYTSNNLYDDMEYVGE